MHVRAFLFSLLGFLSAPALLSAQAAPTAPEALRVFLDCPDYHCDRDYLRTEITFVNWVRDRDVAQVHVLVTTEHNGGGGRKFTLRFIGRGAFEGLSQTLGFDSRETQTDDEVRAIFARTLKLGLVPFLARTPMAGDLTIGYEAPAGAPAIIPLHDPWDYWVFRARLNGNVTGEQAQSTYHVHGSLGANRTTEALKLEFSVDGSYTHDRYDLDSVTTFVDVSQNYGADALVAASLGPHWSLGGVAEVSRSTYRNLDFALRAGPAVEWDLFPYSESTRRQLSILYSIGVDAINYNEVTLFGETSQLLADEQLTVSLDVKQPWGTARLSVLGSHFFHDFGKNRVDLYGEMDIRLYQGLSFSVYGEVSRVRDQLYLPAAGASPEEILLQRRALATNYQYDLSVGFTYTFGSIFNNVVNPRFGETGGLF